MTRGATSDGAGWPVILLVARKEVQLLGNDGSPLRRLTLDPPVDDQAVP